MANGNQGFFELGLIDTAGNPAVDAAVRVTFRRSTDNTALVQAKSLAFPPRHSFSLPAFPQAHSLICEVGPSRWRMRNYGFFTLTSSEPIARNLTVLRNPPKWVARFDAFNSLPVQLLPLQKVLARSANLRVKNGEALGTFIGPVYDGVSGPKTTLAKVGLLNLFSKLMNTVEPVGGTAPWFSFVETVLEIAQDRIIAIVRPEMGDSIRTIRQNIRSFPEYERASASLHLKNMPKECGVQKTKMFSVKTDDKKGNLQLTLGPGKRPDGRDVLVLDADIDENGKLLEHLLDVFKHKLTKKDTHPFDIHEYLCLEFPKLPLGYELT